MELKKLLKAFEVYGVTNLNRLGNVELSSDEEIIKKFNQFKKDEKRVYLGDYSYILDVNLTHPYMMKIEGSLMDCEYNVVGKCDIPLPRDTCGEQIILDTVIISRRTLNIYYVKADVSIVDKKISNDVNLLFFHLYN